MKSPGLIYQAGAFQWLSMQCGAIVYVGFEEGVKFPTGLEHDLNKYIASHS